MTTRSKQATAADAAPTTDDALLLDHQLCFPLYAAARRVTALYTPVLKPLGLTYTQYLVLLALWERDNQTVGELGHRLYLDNGTLTPLLKRMEGSGWVTRSRSQADERVVVVGLTSEGCALKEQVRDVPAQVGRCIDLPQDDAAQLYQLLYQLLETF